MFTLLRLPAALAVICLVFAAAQTAHADSVTVVVTGTWSNIPAASGCAGNGTNTLTCSNGISYAFNGTTFSRPEVAGAHFYSGFGSFTFVRPLGLPDISAVPVGATLTLRLDQLSPTPGTAFIQGVIMADPAPLGRLLIFPHTGAPIGDITYQPIGLGLQTTSLGVEISVPVPEPTSALLFASGVGGIVAAARRRAGRRR